MAKYNVWLPYNMFVVKTVDAESKEEAIEKVLENTECELGLCYRCMEEEDISDNPTLDEDNVFAEEY